MITGRNELKTSKNIFHVSANVNLMEQNVSQINGGIRIGVGVNIKKFIYVKKILFGILLHVIVKMGNIQQVLWMIQCDNLSGMKL